MQCGGNWLTNVTATKLVILHRLSINRPTKRGKEKSPSNGHCQCEKEMEEHLLAC
jgi:hypothetical protein